MKEDICSSIKSRKKRIARIERYQRYADYLKPLLEPYGDYTVRTDNFAYDKNISIYKGKWHWWKGWSDMDIAVEIYDARDLGGGCSISVHDEDLYHLMKDFGERYDFGTLYKCWYGLLYE